MPKTSISSNIKQQDPREVYVLQNVIGDGSFGKVWLATNRTTGEQLALKQVKLETKDELYEYQVEIDILSEVSHDTILRLEAAYLNKNYLWMALEFCSGGALDDIILDIGRPLDEIEVKTVLHYTMKSLTYLHENRVIHRDIKAGNILLDDYGHVKLCDFGVSALNDTVSQKRNTFIGTPYWMAPDVIICETFGDMPYGSKCDVWSSGILAIELAEGDPPHHTINPMSALMVIAKSPPPTLADPSIWSSEFSDWLSLVLKKSPLGRLTAAAAAVHVWCRDASNIECLEDLVRMRQAPIHEEVVDMPPFTTPPKLPIRDTVSPPPLIADVDAELGKAGFTSLTDPDNAITITKPKPDKKPPTIPPFIPTEPMYQRELNHIPTILLSGLTESSLDDDDEENDKPTEMLNIAASNISLQHESMKKLKNTQTLIRTREFTRVNGSKATLHIVVHPGEEAKKKLDYVASRQMRERQLRDCKFLQKEGVIATNKLLATQEFDIDLLLKRGMKELETLIRKHMEAQDTLHARLAQERYRLATEETKAMKEWKRIRLKKDNSIRKKYEKSIGIKEKFSLSLKKPKTEEFKNEEHQEWVRHLVNMFTEDLLVRKHEQRELLKRKGQNDVTTEYEFLMKHFDERATMETRNFLLESNMRILHLEQLHTLQQQRLAKGQKKEIEHCNEVVHIKTKALQDRQASEIRLLQQRQKERTAAIDSKKILMLQQKKEEAQAANNIKYVYNPLTLLSKDKGNYSKQMKQAKLDIKTYERDFLAKDLIRNEQERVELARQHVLELEKEQNMDAISFSEMLKLHSEKEEQVHEAQSKRLVRKIKELEEMELELKEKHDHERENIIANTELQREDVEKRYCGVIHQFLERTYIQPTFCDLCTDILWGVSKQGMHCSICKCNYHAKCSQAALNTCAAINNCDNDSDINDSRESLKIVANVIPSSLSEQGYSSAKASSTTVSSWNDQSTTTLDLSLNLSLMAEDSL